MKLAVHSNSLETNAEVESQDFGIGDVSVVIEMLRKHLYQHRARTLVQEYMCNGRDANRESKTKKQIVVTIPNNLNPVFKVRDFGVGLTPHRIANVFVKYGSSTKRGSNGQTGGFGIGAKSAWAYTDSFTIVSITGGIKRTYVAHIGVSNKGRLDLISEINTDEETGTEIQVAVKPNDIIEFRNSIYRACYFWNEKERPEFKGLTADNRNGLTYGTKGLMIGKELEISAQSIPDFIAMDYSDKCLLVIDGIPYPVSDELIEKAPKLESLLSRLVSKAIIHLGNGIVEVSASRESVADSPASVKAMNTLGETCERELKNHITSVFKAAKTSAEWIVAYKNMSKLAHVDDYSKFGDYQINRSVIESVRFADIEVVHVQLTRKRRSNNFNLTREEGRYINLDLVDHVFFVDADEPIVTQNKRLREYLEKTSRGYAILLNAKEVKVVDPKWVRPASVVGQAPVTPPMIVKTSFADSKKILNKIIKDFNARGLSLLPYTPTVRVPKAKRDRTKEMFTIHECSGHESKRPRTTTVENVTNEKTKYLYVPLKDWDKFKTEFNDLHNYMDSQDYALCGLTEDSIDMVKDCSKFESYVVWKNNFKPGERLLMEMKTAKAKNIDYMKLLSKSSVSIKDKHLARMAVEYKPIIARGASTVPKTLLNWAKDELSQFVTDDEKLTNLINDEYSLIKAIYTGYSVASSHVDELIFYINAKAKGN